MLTDISFLTFWPFKVLTLIHITVVVIHRNSFTVFMRGIMMIDYNFLIYNTIYSRKQNHRQSMVNVLLHYYGATMSLCTYVHLFEIQFSFSASKNDFLEHFVF